MIRPFVRRPGWLVYSVICVAWLFIVWLVRPFGEFPISDSWAYVGSVRTLVETGRLQFSDWGAMNLLTHVGWGGLVGALFGTSYTVLRLSIALLALVTALAIYHACRRSGASVSVALLAVCMAVLNPSFFYLSFSFMTDVTFATMLVLALVLLGSPRRLAAGAGWFAALLGLLCRQNGLAIAPAWGVALLAERFTVKRAGLACAMTALFVVVQFGYQHLMAALDLAPRNSSILAHEFSALLRNPLPVIAKSVSRTLFPLFHLSLYALPMTVPLALAWLAGMELRRRIAITLAGLLVVAVTFLVFELRQWIFPTVEDTINTFNTIGTERSGPPKPVAARHLLTLLTAFAFPLLIAAAWQCARYLLANRSDRTALMAAALGTILFLPLPLLSMQYDRYLIPIAPCLAIALAPTLGRLNPGRALVAAGGAFACIMAALSIGLTHDFMAWKKVQQQAYAHALTLAPAEQIDADWVLNGARFFPHPKFEMRNVQSWYLGQEVILDFRPRVGYVPVAEYPVARWLSRDNAILVQKRSEGLPQPD